MYPEYLQCPRPVKGGAPAFTPTPPDIEGPFWLPNAPFRGLLCDEPTLFLSGRVLDTSGAPVEGAVLDFWQANAKGEYDLTTGFAFRGRQAAVEGAYHLETIRPGDYQIADNPPDFRCAHIHVKVIASGYKPLTTQLYFPDDQYNATDHWFDPRRVITPAGNPAAAVFDFVLEKE